ncbi:hypothetical protein ACFQYP_60160 [Nonomuraea antimicrobica]
MTGASGVVAAGTLASRALAMRGDSALMGTGMPGARVCALGKVTGSRAVDVTLRAPEGAKEVVVAAVARLRGAEGGGLTTMSRTAALRVREPGIPETTTFTGHARRLGPAEHATGGQPAGATGTKGGAAAKTEAAGAGAEMRSTGAEGRFTSEARSTGSEARSTGRGRRPPMQGRCPTVPRPRWSCRRSCRCPP